ncbi:MAG: hypothetical protein ABJE95_15170 [Byssovorax sp.]
MKSTTLTFLGVLTATLCGGSTMFACAPVVRPGGAGGDGGAGATTTGTNASSTSSGGGSASTGSVGGASTTTDAATAGTGVVCTGTEVACPSGCADLASDGANCGACDHSCQGGACVASQCQPVVVVGSLASAREIAIDAKNIYWTDTNAGTVSSVPQAGGSVTMLAMVSTAWAIATDGISVYATEYDTAGGVYSVPVDGGARLTLAASQGRPCSIAVGPAGNGFVYFANQYTGDVTKAAVDGSLTKLFAGNQGAPPGVTTDADSAYWTDGSYPGTVKQGSLGGSSPVVLASGQSFPFSITTDATSVYWTNMGLTGTGDGSVMAVPKAGGATILIADSLSGASHIAVDATNVYWTTSVAGGSVMSAPIGGGGATTLATGQSFPSGVAVDGTTIYWTNLGSNAGDGAVMKLAK